ncbi:MAG: hypothetical protein FRX48_05632 [Lasallia pustulata]|uniref:Zn(2)-C6 fungal-type domain-containing protein n=1 Tax=Lasallia pustulata TaxID=136370 RepID=A0A5M8PL74_9LECA|nr:MAG: hypothetical protein FRX48_05632 [Lasallia pustulata]
MSSLQSRPQIGIERIAQRRRSSEPRESMNCKSCRKRKIKCNRLKPTCEACNVFQCPCIYDAIPKKRGPKTDVLEALVKRVDGLEKQLRHEQDEEQVASPVEKKEPITSPDLQPDSGPLVKRQRVETSGLDECATFSSPPRGKTASTVRPDVLLDTYFFRVHDKPYHILDETTTRQQYRQKQIPPCLLMAIFAVSSRYANHPDGYHGTVLSSQGYANRARSELNIDEPSIENLQTLLLLSLAFFAMGKGRRAYMMLSSGIGTALAQELHRECPDTTNVTYAERETRRRIFWTCYLMDRFAACGSQRPSLIADDSIFLRLPRWPSQTHGITNEGERFINGSNLQYSIGAGRPSQGSMGMLIDIVRILGVANRYLGAGGVKGDSHFPWHPSSSLSKIRQELDVWASGTQETFATVETLFAQADSTTLILSKMVYHLIHCLIYRPFLPVDLSELRGSGQHQSWQVEATNLCFLHANSITELIQLGKPSPIMEWPAFVGYCIATAGTVHVHGSHYKGEEGEVFVSSPDYLSREMQMLSELRFIWAAAQHQRDTVQTIYGCHAEIIKSLNNNSVGFPSAFNYDDFFDRYPDQNLDGAYMAFTDVVVESTPESLHIDNRNNAYQYRPPALKTMPSAPQPPPMPAPVPKHPVFPQLNGHHRSHAEPTLQTSPDAPTLSSADHLAHLTPRLSNLPNPTSPTSHQHLPSLSTTPFSLKSSFSPLPPDPTTPSSACPSPTPRTAVPAAPSPLPPSRTRSCPRVSPAVVGKRGMPWAWATTVQRRRRIRSCRCWNSWRRTSIVAGDRAS